MKMFFLRHKIIFLSALIALIIVFFFIPFILTNSAADANAVNPCPYNGSQFELCNLNAPLSLFSYLQDRGPITSISWNVPIIAFIIVFALFYGELKLIISVISFKRKTKKKNNSVLFLKILGVAAIIFIPLFIINLILNYFGFFISF